MRIESLESWVAFRLLNGLAPEATIREQAFISRSEWSAYKADIYAEWRKAPPQSQKSYPMKPGELRQYEVSAEKVLLSIQKASPLIFERIQNRLAESQD